MISIDCSEAIRYLLTDPCSLYAQSKADPSRLQGDGWGLGFYVEGCLRVIKSEKPVYEEYERFRSIVRDIKSNIVVAHIRRASNPRGLPPERIISIENAQPFSYGNYVFAHNGIITIPDEMASLLGKWRLMIRGSNDSEIYFWYVIKEIHEGRNIKQTLKKFEEDSWRTWYETRGKNLNKGRPYIGLNMILSDGVNLYAYCKYDEKLDGAARSLCYGDQPAMQMAYIADKKKLIVVSEKTNIEESWQPLRSGQLICGRIEGDEVRICIEEI